MNQLLGIILALIVLLFGIGFYQQSQNERIIAQAKAEAIVTKAEAEATAITLVAVTPLVVIVFAGLTGLTVATATVIFAIKRKPKQVTVYLLPNVPRREVWNLLTDSRQELPLIIEGSKQLEK